MADEHTPYCIDGCGQPAIAERLAGITYDGEEIVELVCYEHAQEAGDA